MVQQIRYSILSVLQRLGLKSVARRMLQLLGLKTMPLAATPMDLALKFHQASEREISKLPVITRSERVMFLSGRAHDTKFPLVEGLLGWALRLRGAQVNYLICDAHLTVCELSTVNHFGNFNEFIQANKPAPCSRCYDPSKEILNNFGWHTDGFSQYVTLDDWKTGKEVATSHSGASAFDLEVDGIKIGEHIESSLHRMLLRASVDPNDPEISKVIFRLVINAIVTLKGIQRAFAEVQPTSLVAHHGIYLTAGIACDYARQQGIQVVTWAVAYRKSTVIFSHAETYHRSMITEPHEYWIDKPLDSKASKLLTSYLNSGGKSGWDQLSYNRDTGDSPQKAMDKLQLDPNRPIIGLYTNLGWDARIHVKGNIFEDHTDWLVQTVETCLSNPAVQIVIRVHPAEVKHGLGEMPEKVTDIFAQYFPNMPDHIKVIPPDDELSSYALMQLTTANVVYATKLGLEMAGLGLPTIVAGEALYRGKGFTYDPDSIDQYIEWLRHPENIGTMSTEKKILAQQYAYHFYFRRNIAFPSLLYQPGVYVVKSIRDLQPGKYANLDAVCDSIFENKPFLAETPFKDL
jgi:hypothetical protein